MRQGLKDYRDYMDEYVAYLTAHASELNLASVRDFIYDQVQRAQLQPKIEVMADRLEVSHPFFMPGYSLTVDDHEHIAKLICRINGFANGWKPSV